MPRTILDVSRWQGRIDWDKVKAAGLVSGVMIRAMGNSKEGKPSKPYIDLSGLGLDTIEETDAGFSIGAMVTLRQHSGPDRYSHSAYQNHTPVEQASPIIYLVCS